MYNFFINNKINDWKNFVNQSLSIFSTTEKRTVDLVDEAPRFVADNIAILSIYGGFGSKQKLYYSERSINIYCVWFGWERNYFSYYNFRCFESTITTSPIPELFQNFIHIYSDTASSVEVDLTKYWNCILLTIYGSF